MYVRNFPVDLITAKVSAHVTYCSLKLRDQHWDFTCQSSTLVNVSSALQKINFHMQVNADFRMLKNKRPHLGAMANYSLKALLRSLLWACQELDLLIQQISNNRQQMPTFVLSFEDRAGNKTDNHKLIFY